MNREQQKRLTEDQWLEAVRAVFRYTQETPRTLDNIYDNCIKGLAGRSLLTEIRESSRLEVSGDAIIPDQDMMIDNKVPTYTWNIEEFPNNPQMDEVLPLVNKMRSILKESKVCNVQQNTLFLFGQDMLNEKPVEIQEPSSEYNIVISKMVIAEEQLNLLSGLSFAPGVSFVKVNDMILNACGMSLLKENGVIYIDFFSEMESIARLEVPAAQFKSLFLSHLETFDVEDLTSFIEITVNTIQL